MTANGWIPHPHDPHLSLHHWGIPLSSAFRHSSPALIASVMSFHNPPRITRLRLFRMIPLLLAVSIFPGPLSAQTPEPAPSTEPINLNMPDAPLMTVLQLLEKLTGRYVLRPQSLPAAEGIAIVADNLTRREAITAIETALALNGIGITPLGDKFLKVVSLQQARTEAPEFIEGSVLDLPASNRVITKLFQLQFMRPSELMQFIGLNLNQTISTPQPYERANAVLFTDTVSNLQFVERMVTQLDRPVTSGLNTKFYTLHFAKASDVVTKVRTVLQSSLGNQPNAGANLNADDRTNQIILVADPREHPFYDELIAKFDVKAEPNTRNEVIYLKHAVAQEVSTLLTNLISGRNQAVRADQGASVRPGQYQGRNGQPQPGAGPTPAAPQGGPAAGATPAPATVTQLLAETAQGSEFSERLTIVFDERSNAIVVSGTVDDIRLIGELVAKIDVLLAQVSIEVVIAEVTLKDTDKSGVTALNLTVGPTADGATRITNFGTTVAGWAITEGIVNPVSFNAMMSDVGSKSNVRILSVPNIVTTHNKEGQVKVGQKQPIITGSQSTLTTGGTAPVSTSQVTYQDIAIDLKVTPLIGEDGYIQLKIDQVVNDVIGSVTIDNNETPIIGTRQATSTINVGDGQIVVLGGMQRTKNSASRTKLGFLAEIPLISHIFGGRTKDFDRTELLLFIRPHIIKPDENTTHTNKQIDALSNKDEIRRSLEDPSKQPKEDQPGDTPRRRFRP